MMTAGNRLSAPNSSAICIGCPKLESGSEFAVGAALNSPALKANALNRNARFTMALPTDFAWQQRGAPWMTRKQELLPPDLDQVQTMLRRKPDGLTAGHRGRTG